MPQLQRNFAQGHRLTRRTSAPYTGADGQPATAGPGEPRFDHDEAGEPQGLLIQTPDLAGAPEQAKLIDEAWEKEAAGAVCTVLFQWKPQAGGQLQREAFYTTSPTALVRALMRRAGRHQKAHGFARRLKAAGGAIAWKGQSWPLPDGGVLLVNATDRLDVTGGGDHLLAEPRA